MSDSFYQACEKHSVRRCLACKVEQGGPMLVTAKLSPALSESARDRLNEPISAQIEDVQESPEGAIITYGLPAEEIVSTGIRDRDISHISDPDSYQGQVMRATVAYIGAYTGYREAQTATVAALDAIEKAKQTELDALAQRETSRNALFDLIASEQYSG